MSLISVFRKIFVAGVRVVITGGLSLFLICNAFGDGTYERAKDGKTWVWNNEPKAGDVASWSGDRDRDGYATGFGTLTWYTVRNAGGVKPKQSVYARYFGNMVRGKLNGPVNGHSNRVTNHAIFSNGKRITRWAAGSTPSWAVYRPIVRPTPPGVERTVAENTRTPRASTRSRSTQFAGAERPAPDYEMLRQQSNSPSAVAEPPAEGPKAAENRESKPPRMSATVTERAAPEIDHPLRFLTGPPPTLGSTSGAGTASNEKAQPHAARSETGRLTKSEVIELANAEAQKRGYDPNQYQHSDPTYDPSDHTWSLVLDQKAVQARPQHHKRLSVAVDDETRKTAIVAGR